MPEFLQLLPPLIALDKLLSRLAFSPKTEIIDTINATNRVTASEIFAPHPLPPFDRSTVDGFAVKAADTFGASDSLPAYLNIIGEVSMGKVPNLRIETGECCLIHTGGMLPEGADAVVMIENTQMAKPGEIEVFRALAYGENIIRTGEDVKNNQKLFSKGIRLRPAEIGGLMALGFTKIEVSQKPKVAILSSGDEVISPYKTPKPGQIRDINTYTLKSFVEQLGGVALTYDIIPDEIEKFRSQAEIALGESDIVIFTAGSSVSIRDLTAETINNLGKPGVIVHGVNIRPGKPTILALCNGKPVIGLPGNPVSALVIAEIFVRPLVEHALGINKNSVKARIKARINSNVPSQAGREDWILVRLKEGEDGFEAKPIFGKSNLIFTLARADGMVRIHPDANGVEAGEWVEVVLL